VEGRVRAAVLLLLLLERRLLPLAEPSGDGV
jgi:hypothetical protein